MFSLRSRNPSSCSESICSRLIDGWKAEVEVRQRLQPGQAAGSHRRRQTAAVAQRDLGRQQPLDRLGRREAAAVHPGQHLVEALQRRPAS